MVTGKKYAIDFTMSDGSVKTVEFEVPLAELVGAIMRDGSTPMEGNLPMGGNKVTDMAEPTENKDAATKGYADKKVPLDGSAAMTGDLPMGGHRVTGVGAPEADGDAVNLGYANKHYRTSDWMPTASDVGARPNTWLPSIADIGAAPAGYGLGGNGEPKNWSEIDSLISNGKYQISNINQTINGIPVVSATVEVIYYGYGYGKQILRTVEAASGSSVSYTLERSRGYGGWDPWECDNPPFALGVEYRTTERLEGKPVYKKLINMGILASANGVVSVPHGISGATYIIGCRGIATQQGTQYGYEMASNDIQVEGGYVNWYDRNGTSSYYGYALISYLKN